MKLDAGGCRRSALGGGLLPWRREARQAPGWPQVEGWAAQGRTRPLSGAGGVAGFAVSLQSALTELFLFP